MSKTREYLTAIAIDKGIIQLIKPDGNIGYYRQRGITKYTPDQVKNFVRKGLLIKQWDKCEELPYNWSISFEDEQIMGRAYATFNPNRKA